MDPTVTPTPHNLDITPEETPASWLKQNALNAIIGVALLVVVLYYLHPLDCLMAAAGLTLIIFLHELGHFAAAKFCNVRVETFSIGFGPALPFCSYKLGETTYKLAVVPLGGYVKMLGQEDGVIDGEGDDDPRSFKNQSVGERMFIISAGVIMNLILGSILFVIVYMHGLEEKPAVIAYSEPGGTAWRHGIPSGTEIKKIGDQVNPWFDDIRPEVWGTNKGDQLHMILNYKGQQREIQAEPLLGEGAPFPMLGILPPESLVLLNTRRMDTPPYRPGSAAASANAKQGGAGFEQGDRIVAMTDPDSPTRAVTPFVSSPAEPSSEYFQYQRRLARLSAEPIVVHVHRMKTPNDPPTEIVLPPSLRKELGIRMRMGPIVATRTDSAAEKAAIEVKDGTNPGDRIVEVEVVNADRSSTVYVAGKSDAPAVANRTVLPLDPIRLPMELNRWADRTPGEKIVKLTLLREIDHTEKRVVAELKWDDNARFDLTGIGGPNTPLPINALGFAYQVQTVIDAVLPGTLAATASLLANDTIEAVKLSARNYAGELKAGSWQEIKPHQWAAIDAIIQRDAVEACEIRVNRAGEKLTMTVATATDSVNPLANDDRGLLLMPDFRIQKANDIGEALSMGGRRTMRMIKGIYINLYAMIFGRVSALQTLSGPINLARMSYLLAGESPWRLLLMLALISINLAVVNFLPIPVLDGGHVMFLFYEWIRGKPAPERVQTWLTLAGLAVVLTMMAFVVGLDIYRLATTWIGRI